jgi:predicted N-acetyltransferase YhbS
MSDADYTVVDLRHAPEHFNTVADRIWREWWQPDGKSLADVEAALTEIVSAASFPFTLVAVDGGQFLGTVTSIAADIPARPELGPCLAALWVEPEARGRGIGEALADRLMERLAELGEEYVFLSAKPRMRAYYLLQGWAMIESDIDLEHQDVYVRELAKSRSDVTKPL